MTSTLLEAPTIWELVRRRAELSADRDMLIDPSVPGAPPARPGRRVTFGQLVTLAQSAAAGLDPITSREIDELLVAR